MLIGEKLGLFSAMTGILTGAFYAASAISVNLSKGMITWHDAGLQSSLLATFVGLSLALVAIVFNKQSKKYYSQL